MTKAEKARFNDKMFTTIMWAVILCVLGGGGWWAYSAYTKAGDDVNREWKISTKTSVTLTITCDSCSQSFTMENNEPVTHCPHCGVEGRIVRSR